jgi:protein phosphatase methylesterase 1
VLVLAGTDRLDTELMIGQMQGKFRVVVLADCGHCIQEDVPPPTTSLFHLCCAYV